jgi:superfamily II helicase
MDERKMLDLLSVAERLSLRNIGEMRIDSSFQKQAPIAALIEHGLVDHEGGYLRLTELGEAVARLVPPSDERQL